MTMREEDPFDTASLADALTAELGEGPLREALPTLDELIDELEAADEVSRRRRVHEVIRLLASEPEETRQEYRDALTANQYIGKRDFGSALSSAKKAAEQQRRSRGAGGSTYAMGRDGCLYLREGVDRPVLIARFKPQVVADKIRDDGVECQQFTRIRIELPSGRAGEVDVAPDRLRDARVWSVQAVGPAAAIMAVSRAPEHVLAAAQIFGEVHARHVTYSHTGWRRIGDAWRFLTTSGALGASDLDDSVDVDLGSDVLNRYCLPDPFAAPVDEVRYAVRMSLELRTIVPVSVSVPQLGATYRAPLPAEPDCAVWAVGGTGRGKSAYAALCQQHYGPSMDAKHLPGNWASTGNDLEMAAFALANVLFLVDDYNPQTTERDQAAMRQAAERLIRGSTNGAGRGRLRRDGTPAPRRFARAQVLSTGEDIAAGHSLRARMIITEAETDLIAGIAKSNVQKLAADGVYALAMAGYVRWLAHRYDTMPDLPGSVRRRAHELRSEMGADGQHRRVAEGAGSLLVGWELWLRYAREIGAITEAEQESIFAEARGALIGLGAEQEVHQREADPARIWCRALAAAVTGGTAHLALANTGSAPENAVRWGWREVRVGRDEVDLRPQGECVGWIDGKEVYLNPAVAHEVARTHAARAGTPIGFEAVAIRKRLFKNGVLASTDKPNIPVLRTILDERKRVLHVHWEAISE